MGRLIDTGDLSNRLQSYGIRGQDGFGIFRGKILSVVEDIIMDCPTVRVGDVDYNTGRDDALLEVLEIIDDRISLINKTVPGHDLEQELEIIRQKIEALKGEQ